MPIEFPTTLGWDFSGVVEKAGGGVFDIKQGEDCPYASSPCLMSETPAPAFSTIPEKSHPKSGRKLKGHDLLHVALADFPVCRINTSRFYLD